MSDNAFRCLMRHDLASQRTLNKYRHKLLWYCFCAVRGIAVGRIEFSDEEASPYDEVECALHFVYVFYVNLFRCPRSTDQLVSVTLAPTGREGRI